MTLGARRPLGLITLVGVLLVLHTDRTHAIINGWLDGANHPNVGMVVAEVNGERFAPCSGNLIAPTVFVTAAHCLEFIQSVGATQVWVTFDSEATLDASSLLPGTLHPNPAYDENARDPHDVAVITFGAPVVGITPVVLPTPHVLDRLERRKGLNDQLFTVVGYGATQVEPFVRDLNRRFAVSGFKTLGRALMRLSMHQAQGQGGATFFDSGGAIFLGTSTTMVAIVGLRGTDRMYEAYRLDTPSARAFLADFVTLPD